MWYAQEQVKMGKVIVRYMDGKNIPTDKLTKITNVKDFETFRDYVMGTFLLYEPSIEMDENESKKEPEIATEGKPESMDLSEAST